MIEVLIVAILILVGATFAIGILIGMLISARWAAEAIGKSIRRELDEGRMTVEQARRIIDFKRDHKMRIIP